MLTRSLIALLLISLSSACASTVSTPDTADDGASGAADEELDSDFPAFPLFDVPDAPDLPDASDPPSGDDDPSSDEASSDPPGASDAPVDEAGPASEEGSTDEPNEDEPNEDEPNEDEPNEDEPNEDEPNEDAEEIGAGLDPFGPRPDTAEGLINTSTDLEELLEFGELVGACEAYRRDPSERRLKLLCGKWMFFYEGFGTLGIPQPLMDWMARSFPEEAGPGFTNYGLVRDPYVSTDAQPRHLGVGEGASMGETPTLALTCANCHFGRMPDGRYAVGYPNLQYQYGTHMLALFLAPMKGIPGFDPADHHPDAIAAVQPILDRLDAEPMLALGLMLDMLPLLLGGSGEIPTLSYDNEGLYASWAPGTMDFTMAPLPIEDNVHTVSRTLPLWGIPTVEEEQAYGMESATLAWTGAARSLDEFLAGFVIVGGGPVDEWGSEELSPLREYLESLDAPAPLVTGEPAAVEAGRTLFASAGCEGCHDGARGSGKVVFEFDEIGTDPAMAAWGDGDGDGQMCCDVDGDLTGGIKAPRLTGLYALTRFLHNGSLSSLEQLLCVEPRPPSDDPPYANTGHDYGCDLPDADKAALLTFLRSI